MRHYVQLMAITKCTESMAMNTSCLRMGPYTTNGVGETSEIVYSGTLLLWTPWGPGKVSCTQWNPSIVDTFRTW